ncbi:MAG: hypothetical protein ACK4N5_12190 [Myxococcales bacterium]
MRRFIALTTLLLGFAGCRAPLVPIAPGAVRFVRGAPQDDDPEKKPGDFLGQVSATFMGQAGLVGDEVLFGFASDKAATLWLGEHYDLAFVWGNWLLGVEGMLLLHDGPGGRIGITHGVGGTLLLESRSPEDTTALRNPTLLLDPMLGLFVETRLGRGSVFFNGKYTHAYELIPGAVKRPNHHASAAFGYLWRVGRIRVAPELIVVRSWWSPGTRGPTGWFVEPGIGLSGLF